ncbi:hypothetical protein [Nocardia aobensis]|uniref:hypothetical protein n=1 Tax=Nocardia aobensis TaxID=257277 RepID=UPI00055BB434|nr:hypothetical protein [Nocardia aobensis]
MTPRIEAASTAPGLLSRSPTVTSRSARVSVATASARLPGTAIESFVHSEVVQVVSRSPIAPRPSSSQVTV